MTIPPDETEFKMTAGNVMMSWHTSMPLAPDRLRSFLKYLQEREFPMRFSGFPANLYSASERLINSNGALQVYFATAIDQRCDLTMQVHSETTGSVFSLDFGAFAGLAGLLASTAIREVLVAGARMLSSEYALLAAARNLHGAGAHGTGAGDSARYGQPLAVWIGAQSRLPREQGGEDLVANMILREEQWDGARLLLRREPALHAQQPGEVFHDSNTRMANDTPNASDQRKTICALVADSKADRSLLLAALAHALRAKDWKVRACAMIGAARRGLSELGPAIKSMDLPETSVPGVTSEVRHMLLAMHKASLLLLSGTPAPQAGSATPDTRAGMQAHLLRLMAGEPATFDDDFTMLIHSLTRPESAFDEPAANRPPREDH